MNNAQAVQQEARGESVRRSKEGLSLLQIHCLPMEVRYTLNQLLHEYFRLRFLEARPSIDAFQQIAPVQQFHHYIQLVQILVHAFHAAASAQGLKTDRSPTVCQNLRTEQYEDGEPT